MSAGITSRDNLFTVREAAWHRMGPVLEDYPTPAEAKKLAHPWEPEPDPIYRKFVTLTEEGVTEEYREVEGWQSIVRKEDDETTEAHDTTLGVMPSTYRPVSNSEIYEIAEALQGEGTDVKLETGGSLYGGSKVWLLVRLEEPLVIQGDPHGGTIAYYALQNANDGSASFRGQATNTRVVCDNTSKMADLDASARGTEFVFRHTQSIGDRIEEAKIALAGWRDSVETYRQFSEFMVDVRLDDLQIRHFVEDFIPRPLPHMSSDRVMANVEAARRTMYTILGSETSEGVSNTGYGLISAALEYNQHFRKARSNESRFRRAYLDQSVVTQDAVKIVKEAAGLSA